MRIDRTLLLLVATVAFFGPRSTTNAHAAEEAAENTNGVMVVHVINEAGAPQPNADVSLFRFDRDWRYWEKLDRDTQTDDKGTAKLEKLSSAGSYVVRATTRNEFVSYTECFLSDENARQDMNLHLEHPLSTSIKVSDNFGHPVVGARIWSIEHDGSNGSVTLAWRSLDSLNLASKPSNDQGELRLPALPPGKIDIRVVHSDFAPCELKGVQVGKESAAEATLDPGVKLTLRIARDADDTALESVAIDCRHELFENPSTLIGQLPELRDDGTAELTVAAGKYEQLLLKHPRYVVTPSYSARYGHSIGDAIEHFQVEPGHDLFTFHLKRKVKVRGRVIDQATGQGMAEQSIQGSLHAEEDSGPFAGFADEWTRVDWAETNTHGEYELDLAAGRARVSFEGQGMVAQPDHFDLEVAADGSAAVPDFLVKAMPKIHGVVRDENGNPLPKAVVRFRGSLLIYATTPVAADEQGRFELSPPWIPQDLQTHENLPLQTVVAFDPYYPNWARAEVSLDRVESSSELVLQLEPQSAESLIGAFPADLTPRQRGEEPAEERERLAKISLVGKPAPELDGAQWLNTDKASLSLADFRGKYVLLQFWTTWCGPCHQDMPSVKLLHELYGDKGLAVIGIHNNSMPITAIKEDVAKQKLTYPIVVDHPDGRILASYNAHGISGYPSYVLIDPDGLVLQDDATVAGPRLRSFKIEIVRQLLLSGGND